MFQAKTKTTSQGLVAAILALLFCVVLGCISPEVVKTEIHGIRNDMGQLEKVVEQKANNTVIAEQVDEINNKIEQTTQLVEELSVWRKSVQAVQAIKDQLVGAGVMALIFIGAGFLLIRAFIKLFRWLSIW